MEKSPHKCQVCNRSFNQRSNLKTHLLTHTDHKPYECVSCDKVFRRNCDLRRHALTHTIGGDLAIEINENGNDISHSTNGEISINQNNVDANDVIEVNAPVYEQGKPLPVMRDGIDIDGNGSIKEERMRELNFDGEPPCKMPRLEQNNDDGRSSGAGVTRCHHNGEQTYFSMRPQQGKSLTSDEILYVRQDLHYRADPTSIHTSNLILANAANSRIGDSVPYRKRSAAFECKINEHPLVSSLHSSPLNLSNHESTGRNQDNSNGIAYSNIH